MKLKGIVTGHPAKGAITVESKGMPPFNAVVAYDLEPPEIGSEVEVEARKVPTIVDVLKDGKATGERVAVEVVEHATHIRPAAVKAEPKK